MPILKQFLKRYLFTRSSGLSTREVRHIQSLSTLQSISHEGAESDPFFQQTKIRICAHIAEKDLVMPTDRPRYRQYARELRERLIAYAGAGIASIEWARSVAQRYEDRYGL